MDYNRRNFLLRTGAAMSLLSGTILPNRFVHAQQNANDIQQLLASGNKLNHTGIQLRYKAEVLRSYRARNFAPLWLRDDFPTHTSIIVAQRLSNADKLGLQPSKYYGKLLNNLATKGVQEQLIEFEILMTDSVISYFEDIAHGSTEPPSYDAGWRLSRARLNISEVTDDFFNGNKSLSECIDTLHPSHERFNRLLNSLREYLSIAETGGWPVMADPYKASYGDRSTGVIELRQRLAISGDLQTNSSPDPELFDAELLRALISFQTRHGLNPDGVLGPVTKAELNVPVERRIEQINVNLDRWRWMSRELGNSNITVNTAGYDLDVTLNGNLAMTMNVIVGKPRYATPLFSDTMDHLVYNPSWFVPRSITKKLLKKEANQPGYLTNNNFEVRDKSSNQAVPFDELTPFDLDPEFFSAKYWLRQLPGSDNALGSLKFMFPNKYSIYLHDTNSPELFAKSKRAFSHGCIRLAQPDQLAELLLTADGRTDAEIRKYQLAGTTKKVNFRSPLQVHMTYQTAWVDNTGLTNFREDIYRHDNHALPQLHKNRTLFAQAEINALALSNITLVSSNY